MSARDHSSLQEAKRPRHRTGSVRRTLIRTAATGCIALGGLSGGMLALADQAKAAELEIRVEGLRNGEGKVRMGVCGDPACYDRGSGFLINAVEDANKDGVRFELKDLKPGRYALMIFHDENSDDHHDSNWLGLPVEGFAFSNNATPGFGKPDFDEVAIDLPDGQVSQSITMIYW